MARNTLGATMALVASLASAASGQVLTLDSQADPYQIGSSCSGDPAVEVALPASCGTIVRIAAVLGEARACPAPCPLAGPDGSALVLGCDPGFLTDVESAEGISGIIHQDRALFIAGVFLGPDEPVPGLEPERLEFSDATDFLSLEPELAQLFFIGDGRQIGTGAVQEFIAPEGATRLLLGFADASCFRGPPAAYCDNEGSFEIELELDSDPCCKADLDGDGELTIFDFLAFQNLFSMEDPLADCDGDGAFTIFDFLEFQNLFATGCA